MLKQFDLLLEKNFSKIQSIKNANQGELGELSNYLIISVSDGTKKAKVITCDMPEKAFDDATLLKELLHTKLSWATKKFDNPLRWLRLEWTYNESLFTWQSFKESLTNYKRNYFRAGIAYRGSTKPWCLLTEMELNANACLYGGAKIPQAQVNENNLSLYIKSRHGSQNLPSFDSNADIVVFKTAGVFIDVEEGAFHLINTQPKNNGRRNLPPLNQNMMADIITKTTNYLSSQVLEGGRYEYGHFPVFGRTIDAYNALRHASSTYALIEGYEFCHDNQLSESKRPELQENIESALLYLTNQLIKHYPNDKAYVVEFNDEIKLGANAVAILALVKYYQVFERSADREVYLNLAEKLANGIVGMQQEDGRFVHVLDAKTLKLKEAHRIIYYDGEAAFGLMRLYGVTKDSRWLACVTKAFDYFIGAGHNGAHDHWLSYCSNELVQYQPERKYFEFAVNNVKGYTDFIKKRITTFPTLLELSMAFHKMLIKLEEHPEFSDVLDGFDVKDFYEALHARASHLLNGFFFPEMAMYFKKPQSIVNGCFIRHHSFRVRIDDVEHYLSGWVAYHSLLDEAVTSVHNNDVKFHLLQAESLVVQSSSPKLADVSTVVWGGDVNLGRRQHYLTKKYHVENVLNIPALRQADFSVINLECVISTLGEQGRVKGEGGPYYYRARPEMLEILRKAGVDAVACANNHSGDYGVEALMQQKEILDAAGIFSVGTGENSRTAFAPIYYQLPNGVTIALFSVDATMRHFSSSDEKPGAAYLDPKNHLLWTETYQVLFEQAKEKADLILVAIHWGDNGRNTPDSDEIRIGHRLIDAGADAILGASAHQLQGIEVYKGKVIIHDAGDLLFDASLPKAKLGGVFELNISQKGIECVNFFPVSVGFGKTDALFGDDAINASREFASLCLAMGSEVVLNDNGCLCITLEPQKTKFANNPQSVLSNPIVGNKNNLIDYTQWSAEKRSDLVLDEVPEAAGIKPIDVGGLKLVGLRSRPHFFNRRRMLWIESFWQSNETVDEEVLLHFRAKPIFPSNKMKPWGVGMAHEPCDWLIPASKWQSGKVYRDFYGLRPPYMSAWEDGNLQLEVSVGVSGKMSPFVSLPVFYKLSANTIKYADDLPSSLCYRQKFLDNIYDNHTHGTWNAEQLASITRGKWLVAPPKDWYVDSIVAGPKHISMATGKVMFVANTNDNRAKHENSTKKPQPFDRHQFISKEQDGLVGAIVEYPVKGLKPNFPILQVDDPIKAWMELGIAARTRFMNPVIAVTGTVGKSSVCKMIETMFGTDKLVLSSLDNYNSRVGVPSMMASLSPNHHAAVIEVAQSALWMKRGPITQFLRPNISVLTEIGLSQTQQMNSLEKIAKNKAKIFDGLCGDAVAIVGAHLPHFDMILEYAKKNSKRVLIYGEHPDSEIRIKSVDSEFSNSKVILDTNQGEFSFRLPAPSMGMVKNAMAAFAVMYALREDLSKAIRNIEYLKAEERRFEISKVDIKGGEITIFDDSFNAEYESMLNAFNLFRSQKKQTTGRHIYILGRIVHLGSMAQSIHESLAEPLLACDPDVVITHGDEMHYLREKLPKKLLGEHFSNAQLTAEYIKRIWQPGDVILIKGSSRDSDFGSIGALLHAQN